MHVRKINEFKKLYGSVGSGDGGGSYTFMQIQKWLCGYKFAQQPKFWVHFH